RDRRPEESAEAYGARLAQELDDTIAGIGADRIIGFCAETVGGATAGALPPVPGYFRRIRDICDKHGILLIADEVMCGMGRTGSLHAVEQEAVVPDLMAIAKGLGGGYQPIGAVLVQERSVDAIAPGSGCVQHGPAPRLHARIKAEAMARGLMVYPMGGTIDGRNGDHVLIAPPFIATTSEVDMIVDRLAAAVDAALASVRQLRATEHAR